MLISPEQLILEKILSDFKNKTYKIKNNIFL